MPNVHLLDYVAGNIRSLVNAIEKCGYEVEWIRSPQDVKNADKIILPGVGHFGHCLSSLSQAGYLPAIQEHISSGKSFFGICVGLQALFAGSEEAPSVSGLSLIPTSLRRFNPQNKDGSRKSVPCIGWNDASTVHHQSSPPSDQTTPVGKCLYGLNPTSKYYYVHSYFAPYTPGELEKDGWTVATATYGDETYVGAIGRGNVLGTQFHPEKSGAAGLQVIKAFLEGRVWSDPAHTTLLMNGATSTAADGATNGLTRRIIACLDVRTNDAGDLVVTKGDQYDVREKTAGSQVRNLGKPVDMAKKYYTQGADEVTFLNITSFRDCPVADLPMLEILRRTSETVFVPLTVGGGIRDVVDPATNKPVSALDVAKLYFASGADKVSIGSDAVLAAEAYYASGKKLSGTTGIETISAAYGGQAVVVSVDPKRVYVSSPSETRHRTIRTAFPDAQGREYVWFACTIKGGRETRDLDVTQLVTAVEAMGAGEILLNAIDRDGQNNGYDLELMAMVKAVIGIPVIASSGAGRPAHFEEVFRCTDVDAALGAGMVSL
ncbi:imidazoleglycerol phosphate synthase, cyclase subunit [Rhinocladiella mackenziei CBS 650.93]|uniref:Imidazole glycerol phosphate synthase hisHF n=1 Tax=Rhinocladiella mackenziei CBS 650.93 TaxID=1442369 RepID=A0A0D2H6S5_9EURO|nr:imidazoleglycerol phosphate synthase, cyclase subunit [Rhinocladiella mackenziei CBS 650.93]KIX06098.1 imidazoleglycerol phosphate synthase, cyclase subunit [Rhinocladiella mackenziei CBS 650.93]